MDPVDFRLERRRLLRSLGLAGGVYGGSGLRGGLDSTAGAGTTQGSDVDWTGATATVDEFVGGFVEVIEDELVDLLVEWLETGFDALGDLYDTVTGLADGAGDVQAVEDVHFLYTEGGDLLDRIGEAPDAVEDDEDDEGGDDGGDAASSVAGPAGPQVGAAPNQGTPKVTRPGAFIDVPSVDDIVGGFQSLSSAARDYVAEAYDDVEAFVARIADGLTVIFEEIAGFLIGVFLAPLRQLTGILGDLLTDDDADGIDLALDFPGLQVDLPFSITTPFVTSGESDADASKVDPTATPDRSWARRAGVTASPTSASAGRSDATAPPPGSFEGYLETAYDDVAGVVDDHSAITFDERDCPQARGPVHTMGFEVDLPDFAVPGGSINTDITPWIGFEPARPCVYTGVDPDVTGRVSIPEMTDAVRQNQAEALAVGRYVRDHVEDHRSRLDPILVPDGESVSPGPSPTFRDVQDVATTIRDDLDGLAAEIDAAADLTLDVGAVVDDVGVPDVSSDAAEMHTRVREAVDTLESSQLLTDLLAVHDAVEATGTSAPPQLDEIAALGASVSADSGGDASEAAFELPDLLVQSAPDLAEWIAGLSPSRRRRIERESGVDLDGVHAELTDPGTPVFSISEAIRDFVESYVEYKLQQVRDALEDYLTAEYELTEGWDEWLCAGLCFNPLTGTPVPALVGWIVEETWRTAKELADEYAPELRLPGPVADIAEKPVYALLAIVALVVIVLVVVFLAPYIVAAASAVAGALATAAAGLASIAAGTGSTVAIALPAIVVVLILLGHGDVLGDLLSDHVSGDFSTF